MKKWFRVKAPFGVHARGAIIAPEGLNRESLQNRGLIEKHPVYIGPRQPSADDIAEYQRKTAPIVAVDVVPEPEPELEPVAVVEPTQVYKRRGRHA